jgi:multiple sugar transport system substrate-binding protein
MITLTGVSWDHPRGHDPMVATAEAYTRSHPDVRVVWETRSLKDFGDYPVERLAERYDLILVDHPFAGTAASTRCLLPVDDYVAADYLTAQEAGSVGPSYASYLSDGHLWALPVDAAGQVSALRPDLLDRPVPGSWEEVIDLARDQRAMAKPLVAIPLVPTDAVLSFFSICASLGSPPFSGSTCVVDGAVGEEALAMLKRLAALAHPASLGWNPIRTLDRMSETDEIGYAPLLFGYSNYARPGFRRHLIRFTNVPRDSVGLPQGAILGGVGLAVSARSANPREAFAYACFVADPRTQRTIYFQAGGQPGHRSAWTDEAVNAAANGFFLDTLETLDHAYLRPTHEGYPTFQEEAGNIVHACLRGSLSVGDTLSQVDRLAERINMPA